MSDPTGSDEYVPLRRRLASVLCDIADEFVTDYIDHQADDIAPGPMDYLGAADAIIERLPLVPVAVFRDYPLGSGADWLHEDKERENPLGIEDGTTFYVVGNASEAES